MALAVLLLAGGCDHATKQLAKDALAAAPPISLAADAIRLELATNPGGLLSLGASLPAQVRSAIFLVLVPLLVLLVGAVVLRTPWPSAWPFVALGLVAGGGLANWVDRLLHGGAVTDFVSLGLGSLRTGIFNVADVCVLAGVAILIRAGWDRGEAPAAEPGAGIGRPTS